jgi:hypothetical protein
MGKKDCKQHYIRRIFKTLYIFLFNLASKKQQVQKVLDFD